MYREIAWSRAFMTEAGKTFGLASPSWIWVIDAISISKLTLPAWRETGEKRPVGAWRIHFEFPHNWQILVTRSLTSLLTPRRMRSSVNSVPFAFSSTSLIAASSSWITVKEPFGGLKGRAVTKVQRARNARRLRTSLDESGTILTLVSQQRDGHLEFSACETI